MVSSMTERRVAVRYAKSILELAEERGVLEQVYQDMGYFVKTLDENPVLRAVTRNPIIYSYRKLAILKKLFADKFHKVTLDFFEIIARKNREEILYQAAKEFENLYEERKGILRVTLTSAVPLTPQVKMKAVQIVEKETGKKVKLEEKINPALIGGFTITFANDKQIDASVRTKLKLLEKEFLN
ncbi:MAG: ATP synthase F1 subunit delta [Raineya sp.]|nr:ATP synthase F1 subunit delta [Raineya sp.]MDW8296883.1 ATP synthase F1 subunit delta [Raineya sp.]